ncbi:MAG: hypothetical protein R3E68_22515 [Burkholderiaceae bacterium]
MLLISRLAPRCAANPQTAARPDSHGQVGGQQFDVRQVKAAQDRGHPGQRFGRGVDQQDGDAARAEWLGQREATGDVAPVRITDISSTIMLGGRATREGSWSKGCRQA